MRGPKLVTFKIYFKSLSLLYRGAMHPLSQDFKLHVHVCKHANTTREKYFQRGKQIKNEAVTQPHLANGFC